MPQAYGGQCDSLLIDTSDIQTSKVECAFCEDSLLHWLNSILADEYRYTHSAYRRSNYL